MTAIKYILRHCGVCIVFLFISVCSAQAADIAVVVGFKAVQPFVGVKRGDRVLVELRRGRSYCCTAIGDTGVTFLDVFDENGQTAANSSRKNSTPPLGNNGDRRCFIVPTSGGNSPLLANLTSYQLSVDPGPSGGLLAFCNETTMFGSWNTSVTDFNFLELTNTDPSEEIKAELTMSNVVSSSLVFNRRPIDIPVANSGIVRRVDVDLHTPGGVGFGMLLISHDGAAGTLDGAVSQYNVTSFSPFKFQPVAQSKLAISQ